MLQVNESNFVSETKDGVVVVDFSATWCGPCRALTPILEKVQNAKVVKVDIDQDYKLAEQHKVSAVPKLVFFKNGVEMFDMLGVKSLSEIQAKVDELNNGYPTEPQVKT